ncbi:MAG TPA: hypothetical protein PLI95_29150, partial [Polyangiaceae bacterium]|nr:hypothetical protein [Polyangiaceae bacterium]
SLRLRGCEVKLEHLRRDKAHEVVVGMNAETNHSDPIDEEKIPPAAGSTPTWPLIPLAPSEIRPTRFHKGDESQPWHIDYCFIPPSWQDRIRQVEVGDFASWQGVSDHRPVVVDLDVDAPRP